MLLLMNLLARVSTCSDNNSDGDDDWANESHDDDDFHGASSKGGRGRCV